MPPLALLRQNEHPCAAHEGESAARQAGEPPEPGGAPAATASEARAPALAAELTRVREQEREAQKQLGEARKRIGVDGCRQIIINTAALRGESALGSARRVAAIMAGDTVPTEDLGMTDAAFLAFAEESGRFGRELAESFGPEEARRIVNSPEMCFSSAVHQFAPERPASVVQP